jgi:protease I
MAKIAVPLAADFEDSEYETPREKLCAAGHEITVIGTKRGETVHGKRGKAQATVDAAARDVDPREFDALVIPGGYSPDHLRLDRDVVTFVRRFVETGKLVAAVCHGPQLLIEADAVEGRTLTSWPSVRKDLENAGATWKDAEAVEDGNLITSRKPDDLEAFTRAILQRLGQAAPRHGAAAIGA